MNSLVSAWWLGQVNLALIIRRQTDLSPENDVFPSCRSTSRPDQRAALRRSLRIRIPEHRRCSFRRLTGTRCSLSPRPRPSEAGTCRPCPVRLYTSALLRRPLVSPRRPPLPAEGRNTRRKVRTSSSSSVQAHRPRIPLGAVRRCSAVFGRVCRLSTARMPAAVVTSRFIRATESIMLMRPCVVLSSQRPLPAVGMRDTFESARKVTRAQPIIHDYKLPMLQLWKGYD